MDITQKVYPLKIELDSDENLRTALNAAFLKNIRQNINRNAGASEDGNTLNQGSNAGAFTPIQSPEQLCASIILPTGNNICIGVYNSVKTSELYWFVWNDEGNHSIWVYDTINGCRKVYEGACLNFHFEPEYHVPAHRVALYVVYDSDEDGNQTIRNKFLVFTDGINWQFFIDVESSIATDSYNATLYPYFQTFYPHCDPCEFVQLGIRPPQDCPKVLPFDDDTDLQFYEPEPENNNLKEKMWYFATSFIDIWGRHSVISPYSTAVFLDGGDCKADAEDIKCFRLQLDAGSALVEKIVVYFSNDGVIWFQYDIIDKWENCESPPDSPPDTEFWQRDIALQNYYAANSDSPACTDTGCFDTILYTWDFLASPELDPDSASIEIDGTIYSSSVHGFHGMLIWLNGLDKGTFAFDFETDKLTTSSASIVYGNMTIGGSPVEVEIPLTIQAIEQCSDVNTFIYQFCGNKQCIPIAPSEVARLFDDLPITSIAQAVVDDRVAYSDNKRGYDNFICPINHITITAVQDAQSCESELVDITIDAIIENFYDNINTPIYQLANSTDIAFGGLGLNGHFENEVISAYQQQIVNSKKGFIGGFRGTNYKVVSQQYRINDLDTPFIPENVDFNKSTKSMMKEVAGGNFFIQRFKFKVPKGNYIFEIYSHSATGFNDCAGTSTYYLGTIPKSAYSATVDIKSAVNKDTREILVNACSGDVTYTYYVVIADLTNPKTSISVASDAKSVCGYLKEKDTNLSVELAELHINEIIKLQSFGTDANGFYFATDNADDYIIHLNVLNPTGCAATEAHSGGNTISDKQLTIISLFVDNAGGGMPSDQFNNCGHELVSGTVLDCNGNAIAGVPVMLTRTGRFAITDAEGNYTLLAHDDAQWYSTHPPQRRKEHNVDSVVISQTGACLFTECDGCDTCIDTQHVNFTNSCFHCSSQSPPTTPDDIYNFTLDIISGALTGVKTGGTYAVSIIGYDYLDRNNFAQRIGFFTVPTIQSNGVFAPYHFDWAFTGLMNFPSWVKKIRFAVRGNENLFLLSWAANKIEFVDAAGNVTAATIATNIKVYIDGLNDFNTQNFFNTNTSYQFVAGDRIRYITNGDGSPYDTGANGGLIDLPVSSLVNGNALLIPYDSRLSTLTEFATFELYRVPVCETEAVYWEQCNSIPVLFNEGTQTYEPVITSGTIPFYDTFWFYRSIPTTDQDGLPVILTAPHRYEHHTVSDFWGTGIYTRLFAIGRPFVRNENARQTWYPDEDAWSDLLLADGIINGLATWRTENRKNYFVQDAGGVVAIKAQTGFLWHLCENNWFIVNIAQNLLMITTEGNVQSNPDYFGNKQQKIGNIYGCDFRDTNTIIFREEWISWADVTRGAYCYSNYQTVYDITKYNEGISTGNFQSYWIEKFRQIALLRNENQFTDSFLYLHAGFSPKSKEILITAFGRTGSPLEINYIDDELDYNITGNETVTFSLEGYWSGSLGCTPEAFTEFDSGEKGVQLISFVQAKLWAHNIINPSVISYNNFYGTQCKAILKFVFNGGEGNNNKQKLFLAIRVECKNQKFYCDQATTQTGQLSKIPPEAFAKISNYFEAPILMDMNSEIVNGLSKLIDGTNLYGSWCTLRFLQEAGKENEYFEVSGFIISSVDSY